MGVLQVRHHPVIDLGGDGPGNGRPVPTEAYETNHPTKEKIMQGDTTMTVVGNLTADPELRHTQSAAPVASFTVACTPRTLDRQSGEWRDADPLFLRCTLWRQPAEHVAASLSRGARVIVAGRLKQRSFDTRDGGQRTVVELEVDEIGASMRYATVRVNRISRDSRGVQGVPTPDQSTP